MKSTTQYISEFVYEATNDNGNTVKIDMRPAAEKENQSPVELLISALAACVAVEVAGIIKKKRKTLNDLVIESEYKRKETDPKGVTEVHQKYILTSPNVKEEELSKMIRLIIDGYCSVADSLKANITFSIEVIAE
jgi:putative redox protein